MSLLLLFGGLGIDLAEDVPDLVNSAPASTHGYVIDRTAAEGSWRFALELADLSQASELTWHDITKFYVGDRYQRGADEYLGRYRSAVAQVQLQIDANQADGLSVVSDILAPWGLDTSDLFGVDITLDAGMLMRLGLFRVVDAVTVEWEPLWTGRVETWGDASAARGQVRTHVVTVVDTIGDLANVPTVITGNAIPFDEWIDENLTAAGWLYGVDYYGDTADAGLPQDLDEAAAINRMDQACDPLGLVWRSLRTGRLVVHPAPWNATNSDRYDNPLLDSYPDGLRFTYAPDVTDIEYVTDDDGEPFGIQRTSLGILNSLTVTAPGPDVYAIDDPVSAGRYGTKAAAASWIIVNHDVADEILAARTYASAQATPLRTTIDHEGFWKALAIIDHLDPVTVVHATSDTGPVVTATGTVRNIVEERTFRAQAGVVSSLSWVSTIQMDLDAVDSSPALLPVESLALVSADSPGTAGPSSAEFSWTNPTQPDVTPTEVQLRVLGRSPIWYAYTYGGTGADGAVVNWLDPGTWYTLQVRLVRRVNGVVTHVSANRQYVFATPNRIAYGNPGPGTDAGGNSDETTADIPDEADEGCEMEARLQENDGTGWVTIDTYAEGDLIDNGDGTFNIPPFTPEADKIYRVQWWEDCSGVDGPISTGPAFDPPEDWDTPCITPPALSDEPYDDAIVYVPKICHGTDITEAISGITGTHGSAFDGLVQELGNDDVIALSAIAQPDWADAPGGIIAYGECPQTTGLIGDKTISVRCFIVEAEQCILWQSAAMEIFVIPSGAGFLARAKVYGTESSSLTATSTELDLNTIYHLAASYDQSSGTLRLYVNTNEVDDSSFGTARNTINALPVWVCGAPPESWVTDCAVWSSVLSVLPPAPFTDNFNRASLGADWTQVTGTATMPGTVLRANGGTNLEVALAAGWQTYDQYIEATVAAIATSAASGTVVLYGRWTGGGVGIGTMYAARHNGSATQWEITRCVGATVTVLATFPEASPSIPYRVRLEILDESGDVRLNLYNATAGSPGTLKLTALDTDASKILTGTTVGLRADHFGAGDVDVDNFEVGPF